jgi:hypothetical protein
MTLYPLQVRLQTFLSVPITQKCQILCYDRLVANELNVVTACPDLCTIIIIIIIIVIVIILGISFMQGIYTYIPETNHISREHRVATILVLLFMVLISLVPALTPLYFYVGTFRSMWIVPNMAVFCSSLISRLLLLLLLILLCLLSQAYSSWQFS